MKMGTKSKTRITSVDDVVSTFNSFTVKFVEFVNPIYLDQLGFMNEEILEVMQR